MAVYTWVHSTTMAVYTWVHSTTMAVTGMCVCYGHMLSCAYVVNEGTVIHDVIYNKGVVT